MSASFLDDAYAPQRSMIISQAELTAREGITMQKGMNFRDSGPLLSVLLVLSRKNGFHDVWQSDSRVYIYQGHDSVTVEEGALRDQVLMYEGGRLSDNGKFYKAAEAYKNGLRKEPLQTQLYEKLDFGVWYDKGIFNLVDAACEQEDGRREYNFSLVPCGKTDDERMMAAAAKTESWRASGGRCGVCSSEEDLYFVPTPVGLQLLCGIHGGKGTQGIL